MSITDTQVAVSDRPLHEQVGESASIMLEAPSIGSHRTEGCLDLMTPDTPSNIDAMCIPVTHSPNEWLDRWHTHVGAMPARTGIVTTDDPTRSAASEAATIALPDGSLRVDTVSGPGNLTGLGVAITEHLEAYRESDTERPLVVCMDSVGTLLEFNDTQRVFQFLHTLSGQIETAGAVAHCHLDPRAYEDQTVRMFRTLSDAAVSYTDEDGWTVQTR